jgi:hypothetical protein
VRFKFCGRLRGLPDKRFCNHDGASGLKQRLDDDPETVVAQSQAPVFHNPGGAALDEPAPCPSPIQADGRACGCGGRTEGAAQGPAAPGIIPLVGEDGADARHDGEGGQEQGADHVELFEPFQNGPPDPTFRTISGGADFGWSQQSGTGSQYPDEATAT